jgi:hypothetical protein
VTTTRHNKGFGVISEAKTTKEAKYDEQIVSEKVKNSTSPCTAKMFKVKNSTSPFTAKMFKVKNSTSPCTAKIFRVWS